MTGAGPNDVNFTLFNEQNEKIGEYHAYIKNLHVGNAPADERDAGELSCMPVSGLTLGVDFNYYGRHYADFAATDRTDEKRQGGSLEAAGLFDGRPEPQLRFQNGYFSGRLFGNVNNLFNRKYISDALDGSDHTRGNRRRMVRIRHYLDSRPQDIVLTKSGKNMSVRRLNKI